MKEKLNPFFASLAESSSDAFSHFGEDCDWLCWADPFYPASALPKEVRSACIQALDGPAAHYTLPTGLTELRQAVAGKVREFNGLDVDPLKELFIIGGSDTGLFYAMMPFITPGAGDEILIFDPSYMGNFTNAALLGAKAVHVDLDPEDWSIDFDALEAAVNTHTKLLVMTNPNNPTGRSYTHQELLKLAAFVEKHDLAVVVDQAFEECVFSGHEMVTFAALPGMWERTSTVFTTSKGMGLCGFRVAYIVSCARISKAYQRAVVSVGGAPNTLAQYGALAAFQNRSFVERYAKVYESRTRRSWEMLQKVPGIRCHMPDAGYYLWVDVSQLGTTGELVDYLARQAKVIVTGGSGFGRQGEHFLRIITIALDDDERYFKAMERLCRTLENFGQREYN